MAIKTQKRPKFTGSKKMTFLFQLNMLSHLWQTVWLMERYATSTCVTVRKAVKLTQCHENNTAKMCQKKEKTFRKYEIWKMKNHNFFHCNEYQCKEHHAGCEYAVHGCFFKGCNSFQTGSIHSQKCHCAWPSKGWHTLQYWL